MAYFNHAFSKGFLANTQTQTKTESTLDLNSTTKQFAFIQEDYSVMDAAEVAAMDANTGFYIAQGSLLGFDKLGDGTSPHGGYAESHKSKMIKAKYITDMWMSSCEDEAPNVALLQIRPTADKQSCFTCDANPMFRIDIKGAAALRMLNHNAYGTLNGALAGSPATQAQDGTGALVYTTGLDNNQIDMCCTTQDPTASIGIAPSIVAINLRDQFNNNPLLSKFATATLEVSLNSGGAWNPVNKAQEQFIYTGGAKGVTAGIAGASTSGDWDAADWYRVKFTNKSSCALQTEFGNCSFDTRDYYLLGDLKVIADLQDETGASCPACEGFVTFSEDTEFKQRRTSAETVVRCLLMTENYRQTPYNQGNKDSARFREIEGTDKVITAVGRDSDVAACKGVYRVFHLVHNVPRFNNPTGVFDNDQYHYKVYTKCSGGAGATIEVDWVKLAITAGILPSGTGTAAGVTALEKRGGNY
tara:strand:- start:1528 stop:2943 length:1416 start_codon:yes stop_codon:yes gene_type:complete